jgi:uncharacterized membrane protein
VRAQARERDDADADADREAPPGVRGRQLLDALTAAVALIGLADAVYLTAEKLSGKIVPCVVTQGCETVLTSEYAILPGDIPLAALGAAAYFAVFALATLAAFGYTQTRAPLLILVGLMFAFTLRLLYLQAFVLNAYCAYCLLSAAVTTTLTALQLARWLLRPRAAWRSGT